MSKTIEQQKSSHNCVIENILEFHKMITMDLKNEYLESENNSSLPWYFVHP